MQNTDENEAQAERPFSQRRAFLFVVFMGLALIPASFALARLLSIDVVALLRPGVYASIAGIAATIPLALLLAWFMRTRWRPLAELRRSQIEFLSQLGFDLTPVRIIVLSIVAGASEELLFRGVLQTALDRHFAVLVAIALPSVLFGALHAKTLFYAVAAGIAGAYFGILFWGTSSLFAPIVTHSAYDYIALEWARRAIADQRTSNQNGRAKSSGSSVSG